jgi:hypothetical protein
MQTNLQVPTFIIPNTTPGIDWENPSNILLADSLYATATGSTQVLTVGYVGNLNLSQGDVVTNIVVAVKGYRGSFNTTLQIFYIDDTTGIEYAYPLLPSFQGFDGTNTLWSLPPSLFATTFTVDQINNFKLRMIADGELHLDTIQVNVIYTPVGTLPAPVTPPSGETVCGEYVQAQRFQLAQSMTSSDTTCLVQSFDYSDGTPIQITDFSGGSVQADPNDYEALIVIDQGVEGKEENVRITAIDHNFNGTGFTRLSFGSVANRGLAFKWPYTTDVTLRNDHTGTAEVVISNSAPFYDRFLKKCQIGALVSAPISVLKDDVSIVSPATKLNFHGSVTVIQDGTDAEEADIYINAGGGTTPPQVVGVGSGTSGNVQVDTLTYTVPVSGLNRGGLIQISTEEAVTVVSVDVGGTAAVQVVSQTDVPNNLRSEQWICVAPPLGTQTVTITLSAIAYISSGSEILTGVDPVTPTGTFAGAGGTDLNPTVGLVTTYDNSLIFDGLVTALTPIVYTEGSGQTLQWSHTANTDTRQGGSSVEPSGLQPDAITMDYAITQNTDWVITAVEVKGITTASASGQAGIQWEDEGVALGAPNTVDEVDFTGAGVTASRVGNKVTVNVPGGGGALSLETDGVANGDQTLLNLISGTGITLTDDGLGGVTIDATGGGSGTGSNLIENLTAGEDIDGVTEPCVVFIGSGISTTPSLSVGAGNAYAGHTLAYDWTETVGPANQTISALARRASPITTPAHFTTINQIAIWVMESTTASTVTQNVEIGIYDDNAGEPGTLIANFTDTSYPVINSNNYGYIVNLGQNVQLTASTTYWIVVEFVTNGATPLNFFQSTDPTVGLIFSGGNWIAGSMFTAGVYLNPFSNQVYKSYYAATSDEVRKFTLGITTQNIAEGNPIDVYHDGIIPGYTGLTAPDAQYVSTNVPGEIQTSSTNTVKIANATKSTEIVINRVATYQ